MDQRSSSAPQRGCCRISYHYVDRETSRCLIFTVEARKDAGTAASWGSTMSPRLRRLQSDQQSIVSAFAGHPAIEVTPLGPAPAERYRVIYRVPALRLTDENQIQRVSQAVVEIALPAGYPREKPYCTASARIFHPNFGAYVCIADFWNPGNTIVDVIVQIGDMLQYKLYNTASPLNALAARWVSEHLDEIPLGDVQLIPIEPEIVLGPDITQSPGSHELTTEPTAIDRIHDGQTSGQSTQL